MSEAPNPGGTMNRKQAWFAVAVVLALLVSGVLVPSLRADELTVDISNLFTVATVAVITGTLLSVGTRDR
ncbi:hypothetical protein [Lentzea sp. NPDC055074]